MKDCAFVEITILDEEKHIKFLRIRDNTACELIDGRKYYIKINGNQFLKVLEHYRNYVAEYPTKATNDMLDLYLCHIKFDYNGEFYHFSFNSNNSELLELATKMYEDFKDVIIFSSIDYEDVVFNITRDIRKLKINSKFELENYWHKCGIISNSDKKWLFKQIFDLGEGNQYAKLVKKPFKCKYLSSGIRIKENDENDRFLNYKMEEI